MSHVKNKSLKWPQTQWFILPVQTTLSKTWRQFLHIYCSNWQTFHHSQFYALARHADLCSSTKCVSRLESKSVFGPVWSNFRHNVRGAAAGLGRREAGRSEFVQAQHLNNRRSIAVNYTCQRLWHCRRSPHFAQLRRWLRTSRFPANCIFIPPENFIRVLSQECLVMQVFHQE